MLATLKTRKRHRQLMHIAHDLLRGPNHVTPEDVATQAFGRHQIDLDTGEAQRFLDAARIARGETALAQPTA